MAFIPPLVFKPLNKTAKLSYPELDFDTGWPCPARLEKSVVYRGTFVWQTKEGHLRKEKLYAKRKKGHHAVSAGPQLLAKGFWQHPQARPTKNPLDT